LHQPTLPPEGEGNPGNGYSIRAKFCPSRFSIIFTVIARYCFVPCKGYAANTPTPPHPAVPPLKGANPSTRHSQILLNTPSIPPTLCSNLLDHGHHPNRSQKPHLPNSILITPPTARRPKGIRAIPLRQSIRQMDRSKRMVSVPIGCDSQPVISRSQFAQVQYMRLERDFPYVFPVELNGQERRGESRDLDSGMLFAGPLTRRLKS
jgi:hypothetical protein